ncbi:MAG: tRNA threonylcarbamoyladenosine biosynthesis protein TsaB [Halieaceae bacterium]|jgi:tRNA threonylcarbamoyladenosine biosynthesis protein TsaB
MINILAIDTATDACSVAVFRDGQIDERHEIAPRRHNHRLPAMLRELFASGDLKKQGVEAIAYGCGPGSFTGLRIAASAVQGLAFSNRLPAIPVSTLACQVVTAARLNLLNKELPVLSLLDAKVNEVYWGCFQLSEGLPVAMHGPGVSAPEHLSLPQVDGQWQAVGDGCQFYGTMLDSMRSNIHVVGAQVLPRARDMIPLAMRAFDQGLLQQAHEVCPVYVRDEISWKKLDQQGKKS